MSPDQINQQAGRAVYRCRVCQAESGLHWYAGTSCPVCAKPECTQFCNDEIAAERERMRLEDEEGW